MNVDFCPTSDRIRSDSSDSSSVRIIEVPIFQNPVAAAVSSSDSNDNNSDNNNSACNNCSGCISSQLPRYLPALLFPSSYVNCPQFVKQNPKNLNTFAAALGSLKFDFSSSSCLFLEQEQEQKPSIVILAKVGIRSFPKTQINKRKSKKNTKQQEQQQQNEDEDDAGAEEAEETNIKIENEEHEMKNAEEENKNDNSNISSNILNDYRFQTWKLDTSNTKPPFILNVPLFCDLPFPPYLMSQCLNGDTKFLIQLSVEVNIMRMTSKQQQAKEQDKEQEQLQNFNFTTNPISVCATFATSF